MDINQLVNRAYVESMLSGVPLPASRAELVAYAEKQERGGAVASLLHAIPDRESRALQDVGEELEPRQPEAWKQPPPTTLPREDSDVYPGGPAYVGGSIEPLNVEAARNA